MVKDNNWHSAVAGLLQCGEHVDASDIDDWPGGIVLDCGIGGDGLLAGNILAAAASDADLCVWP